MLAVAWGDPVTLQAQLALALALALALTLTLTLSLTSSLTLSISLSRAPTPTSAPTPAPTPQDQLERAQAEDDNDISRRHSRALEIALLNTDLPTVQLLLQFNAPPASVRLDRMFCDRHNRYGIVTSLWTGVGFDTSLGQPTGTRRRISLPSRVSFRTMPELMTSEGEQDKEMNKLAAAELSRRRGWKKILGEQTDGLG